MKSKKVTMLVAALVVAVVAAAGIGYAAVTQYTATTENSGNTLKTTYITVSQDSTVGYAAANLFDKVYFDTVKTASSVTYSPVFTHYTTQADANTYVPIDSTHEPGTDDTAMMLISKPLTLTIAKTNSGAQIADMEVTVSNFSKLTNVTYRMILVASDASGIVASKSADVSNTGLWAFNDFNLNTAASGSIDYTVYLFAFGTITESADTLGFNAGGVDSVFTFKVIAEPTTTDGA